VGAVTTLVFSQNGQSVILGSRYGTIRQFDISKGDEIGTPAIYNPCDKPYEAEAKIGPLRRIPGVKGAVKNVADTCEMAKDIGDIFNGRFNFFYETSIRSVTLHRDGNLLAWSLGDNTVRVTDLKEKKEIYNIPPEKPGAQPTSGLQAISQALTGRSDSGGEK